ncbi:flagellar type III secretion system pore protein FliP [Candidatus Hydrogenedentota bacterium]
MTLVALMFCLRGTQPAYAQLPKLDSVIDITNPEDPQEVSKALQVMIWLTVLTMAPAILLMTTCFSRIVMVLGFLRQAMATQSMPSNQVVVGLALFLSFFIMSPVWIEIKSNAYEPYIAEEITQAEALEKALVPMRRFMFTQIEMHNNQKDIALFINLAELPPPATRDDVPTHVLIPAFIISELEIAFTIGFLIYVPFLIIDMVVASTLMSMGMMMLPPIFISLPFKIVMFILADGWYHLIQSLVQGFG